MKKNYFTSLILCLLVLFSAISLGQAETIQNKNIELNLIKYKLNSTIKPKNYDDLILIRNQVEILLIKSNYNSRRSQGDEPIEKTYLRDLKELTKVIKFY